MFVDPNLEIDRVIVTVIITDYILNHRAAHHLANKVAMELLHQANILPRASTLLQANSNTAARQVASRPLNTSES
jgi:hypothetical protein